MYFNIGLECISFVCMPRLWGWDHLIFASTKSDPVSKNNQSVIRSARQRVSQSASKKSGVVKAFCVASAPRYTKPCGLHDGKADAVRAVSQ